MGKIVYHGGKVDGKEIAAVSDRQTGRQTDRQTRIHPDMHRDI